MKLETFDFNSAPVRVMLRNDEPWFVAADVCRVLEIANSRDAVSGLDDDEKTTVANTDSRPGQPGAKSFQIISESGLYALVFKSRKPEAKTFRKWVTSEVLPTIRKTGQYEMRAASTAPRCRTVRDDMGALRGLLLSSAAAVQSKTLDVGRAQQVANLAARFLETIKMEGDAIGYEKVFELPAGEASYGLLQAGDRHAAEPLQELPQCCMPQPGAEESGVSIPPVHRQETLGEAAPTAGENAPAPLPGAADLGPEANGCADTLPRAGGSALDAD